MSAGFFYLIRNPKASPTKIAAQDGSLVKAIKQKVPMVKAMLRTVFSKGWNNRMAPAATSPALAALMPSNEARMGRNAFKLAQRRIIKKIKNVPGKNIPPADIIAPKILPPTPNSRMDNAPM